MSLAILAASRSKDNHTQHGAIIVSPKKQVLSTGYNGGCRKISDRSVDWSRPNKYSWILHSECNAILFAGGMWQDGNTLYVTGPPCSRCALLIAHVGISRVVYGQQQSACVNEEDWALSRRIFDLAGVSYCEHQEVTGGDQVTV